MPWSVQPRSVQGRGARRATECRLLCCCWWVFPSRMDGFMKSFLLPPAFGIFQSTVWAPKKSQAFMVVLKKRTMTYLKVRLGEELAGQDFSLCRRMRSLHLNQGAVSLQCPWASQGIAHKRTSWARARHQDSPCHSRKCNVNLWYATLEWVATHKLRTTFIEGNLHHKVENLWTLACVHLRFLSWLTAANIFCQKTSQLNSGFAKRSHLTANIISFVH